MSGHDSEQTSRSSVVGSRSGTLKWTYQTPSEIRASPVIDSDGTTYIVSGGVGTDSTHPDALYALRPDGTLKWSYAGTFLLPPVLGADGTIYVSDFNGRLMALGRDSKLKWSDSIPRVGSSRLVGTSDGTIYEAGSKLFARSSNGTVKWSYTPEGDSLSSLAVGPDGTVYVEAGTLLLAVNPNGSLKWSYKLGGEDAIYQPLAIASDGTVYAGSGYGKLYAIDSSGHLKWTFAPVDSAHYLAVAIGKDGTIYSAGDRFYAITPSGKVKWSYGTAGFGVGTPCVDSDGTIYFVTYVGIDVYDTVEAGAVVALNPNGTLKWSHKVGESVGGDPESSPAIGPNGGLYVGCTDGRVYMFSK